MASHVVVTSPRAPPFCDSVSVSPWFSVTVALEQCWLGILEAVPKALSEVTPD